MLAKTGEQVVNGKAEVLDGFSFIGIEREAEYLEIAKARIAHVSP